MAEVRPGSEESPLNDRSIADLLKELSDQTTTLARQEVELAKAELAVKGKQAGMGAGMFGGAGVLAFFAFGAFTGVVILLLDKVMDTWVAALIVAAVYAAIAGVLALTGKNKVQQATPPAPERTVETVKEDVEVVKQSAKAGRQ